MISPDGEDDGITVMSVDDVIRVDTNGQYEEKMQKLCSKNANSFYDLSIEDEEILMAALLFAIKEKQMVSIELLNSGYNNIVGFVSTIDDGECKIEQVDEYGFADGTSYISYNDITRISISTKEEKRIVKLWMLNQRPTTL